MYKKAIKANAYFATIGFLIFPFAKYAIKKTNSVFRTKAMKQYVIDLFRVRKVCADNVYLDCS